MVVVVEIMTEAKIEDWLWSDFKDYGRILIYSPFHFLKMNLNIYFIKLLF